MKRRIQNQLEKADKQENKRSIIIYGMSGVGKTYTVLDHVRTGYDEYLYLDVRHDEFFNVLLEELSLSKTGNLDERFKISIDKAASFFSYLFKIDTEYLVNIPLIIDNASEALIDCGLFEDYKGSLKLFIITDTGKSADRYAKVLEAEAAVYHMLPMDFGEFLTATDHEWYDEVISGHVISKRKIPDMIHEEIRDLFDLYIVLGGCPEVIEEYNRLGSTVNIIQKQDMIRYAVLYNMISRCPDTDIKNKLQNVWDAMETVLTKDNHKFMYIVIREGATKQKYAPVIEYMRDRDIVYKVEDGNGNFRLYAGDFGMYEEKSDIKIMESMLIQNIRSSGVNVNYWESGQGANVSIIAGINGVKVPVEIKYSGKSNLRSVRSYLKLSGHDKYITLGHDNIKYTENEYAIPFYASYRIGTIGY